MKIIIRNCNVAELDIPLKYATKLYNELSDTPMPFTSVLGNGVCKTGMAK
jgi:hypothetical protein